MTMNRKRKHRNLLFVFGTRPEALKLAPIVRLAKERPNFNVFTCLTGQHREMVDQVLRLFSLHTDFDLNLMERGQTLSGLTQRLFPKMDEVFAKSKPDLVVVQGDTTTCFAVALKAFYKKIPIAHVEAGLRTFNKYQPFPEEMNRTLVSHLAHYHFAPTERAKDNLLREGINANRIFVTGNTVVDALKSIQHKLSDIDVPVLKRIQPQNRILLVTAHRRESFGKPLRMICRALKDIKRDFKDVEIIYPVHLNPRVQSVVKQELGRQRRIHLIHPLSYVEFLSLLKRSFLILTDSGGVQEEAPSFNKPVLVMRSVSEREEGIKLGVSKIVGTSREKIYQEAKRLLSDPSAYERMTPKENPYGDGRASERILHVLSPGWKQKESAQDPLDFKSEPIFVGQAS